MTREFLNELRWRGLLHDSMPGVEEHLNKGVQRGYIGFDPTADSLHVGNLVQIMILVHFQRCGHKPIALVGGATGMVGDPSGKRAERDLLDEDVLRHNQASIQAQLERFLDFDSPTNAAEVVNNYDWFKDMGFLRFIRDVGKHITVNYMMAKDSVKSRLDTGLSFTEFSYQLVQGYDFYWLYKNKGCSLQMGGSDQWGNITTGTELVRRMDGGEAFAITTPLLTKSDGSKFGKSEGGNVWLDAARTSPYKFYQFWYNVSDDEALRFLRIFTLLTESEVNELERSHLEVPHHRQLQKTLAKHITILVHGEHAWESALRGSKALFHPSMEHLVKMNSDLWSEIFEGVPQHEIEIVTKNWTTTVLDLMVDTGFLPSKGEAKRALKEGSITLNKQKIQEDKLVSVGDLVCGRYLLLQRGKKNYFLVKTKTTLEQLSDTFGV